jgi:TP901 family phage tail tape measure protein
MAGPRSSIDVFLSLHNQRKFSSELKAAGTELESLGVRGTKSMERFARKSEALKSFGKSWTRNISLPVAGLGIYAAKTASDFDGAMSLISSQAGGSAKEVEYLKQAVLGMHNQFTPLERAKGLFFIESAGLRGAKAMKMLQSDVELATTGNANLEHTVFGTVGAMNALGKEGKNFTKIASVMNAAVGHGHMYMEEFVGAISTGLVGAAKSFGVSWAGMSSAVAFFTRMGEPAQQVATRLRQTITHLATNASTKGAEALDSIGMSTQKMGERIRKSGRIGPVIKELAEHLKAVSRTKADQVLTDAFGGGRFGTQVREATQRWQLLLRTEKEVGKFGTAKRLKHAFLGREEQPQVKLKEAWAELSGVLVNLGNVVLPAAVPALQKLTSVISGAGHAFGSMSPELQAAVGGFLLLTGPVAHGLGYFAGATGKALVLANKFGKAASIFSSTLSPNVMTQGSGFRGAFGAASKSLGLSGAMETAKGFAYALGPAVAAYGVGNIVVSATSGDWGEAGLEAGGAFVGGLAGYIAGGPVGGMLGIGLGSLAGELTSSLFGSGKTITAQQRFEKQAQKTKKAIEGQKKAGESLARSGKAVVEAHHRQKAASQEVRHAEHALERIREQFGPNSAPAIRAEIHLARAGERRLGVTRKLHHLEHKHGEARSIFKQQNAYAILQERTRIKELKGKVKEARSRRRELMEKGVTGKRLAQADENLLHRKNALWKEHENLANSFAEADKFAGPKWAHFVQHANDRALELGHGLTGAKEKVEGLEKAFRRLSEMNASEFAPFKPGAVKEGVRKALAKARQEERELGGGHRGSHHRHRTPSTPSGGHKRLNTGGPNATRLKIEPGSLGRAVGGDIHITVLSQPVLDGKVIAESTTKHVRRAQNLE